MEEWKEYQLKDVTTILGDGLHGTPEYDDNGTVFFINGNNLVNGKIEIKDSTKRVSKDEANKYKKNLTERTILVSINGTIGNVAKYKGEACILGKSACYFNVADNFDLNFIYYVVASQQFKDSMTRLATGTTIKNVSLETMRNYSFPAPSINEQKRISAVLSSLDSKIELNRRINDNLEQQAQLLFDNLINASDWSTTQFLSELSEINPPRKLSKGEYAPFVEMSNMPTSGSFPSRIDYKEYNGGMKFRNGDTIMARITPCLENGKAAYVNFLKENEIGFGSTEYIVLAPKKTISSSFLYFLVRNKEFVDYAVKHMNGSSGRQRVSGDTIGNYQLPILDRNKLSIFIAIADRTLSKIRQNSFEIINLAKQRDTLLPKLMFGELKINDLNC